MQIQKYIFSLFFYFCLLLFYVCSCHFFKSCRINHPIYTFNTFISIKIYSVYKKFDFLICFSYFNCQYLKSVVKEKIMFDLTTCCIFSFFKFSSRNSRLDKRFECCFFLLFNKRERWFIMLRSLCNMLLLYYVIVTTLNMSTKKDKLSIGAK